MYGQESTDEFICGSLPKTSLEPSIPIQVMKPTCMRYLGPVARRMEAQSKHQRLQVDCVWINVNTGLINPPQLDSPFLPEVWFFVFVQISTLVNRGMQQTPPN